MLNAVDVGVDVIMRLCDELNEKLRDAQEDLDDAAEILYEDGNPWISGVISGHAETIGNLRKQYLRRRNVECRRKEVG